MRASRIHPEAALFSEPKPSHVFHTKTKFPKKGDPIYSNPEVFMSPKEQLERRGYSMEEHNVETKDGYILTLFRIPAAKGVSFELKGPAAQPPVRPVALFAHGIAANGGLWFLNSDENCLWTELLKLGFDCWFNNVRGSRYSKKHNQLSNKSKEFWKFSYHEMGEFDIPAVLDYILRVTSQQKIFYIGHSMGCAILFVAASLQPEIASKIKLMIALAPAVYVANTKAVVLSLGSKLVPGKLFTAFNHGQSFLDTNILTMRKLHPWTSGGNPNIVRKATWAMWKSNELIAGKNHEQMNWEWMPLLAALMPCSLSNQTFDHFLQAVRSKEFQFYDHGKSGNRKRWGQSKPPKYDLQKSIFPVAIFSGKNDLCCQPKDIQRLGSELPNVVGMLEVQHPKWSHNDFILARETKSYLNVHVMNVIQRYS